MAPHRHASVMSVLEYSNKTNMLSQTQARNYTHQILQRCAETQAEVVLMAEEKALTRFANNAIHQNVAESNLTVYLHLITNGHHGMASTNRQDAEALDELVARARASAKNSPADPERPGPADPAEFTYVTAFDEETAAYPPQERAAQVGSVCRLAAESGLNAFGAFSTGYAEIAVANSQGLFAYHTNTECDFQVVVMGEDSSGRAQASGWKIAGVDPESLGKEAIAKAKRGRDPRSIQPGEYPVVVDPYATEDLLSMMNLNGMGGLAVLEGRSWMNDRLGKLVLNPLVSIWDDGLDPRGIPLPFDFEGVPKRKAAIVTDGVVKNPVYDRTIARKAGTTTTGHALPPNLPPFMRNYGPIALNLFMAPGDTSLDEMIRSMDQGLYITRFWYTRLVHPRDCIVTGMTRDGVFMIERGEIAYPVKNLRFTQSYVQALASVEAVGKDTRLLKTENGSRAISAPGLKMASFRFTGQTV